jgi:hypothetical protein
MAQLRWNAFLFVVSLGGCGPSSGDGDESDADTVGATSTGAASADDAPGGTSSGAPTDDATTSSDPDTSDGTTTSSADGSSTGDGLLLPPGSTISMVTCQDDGTVNWLVEVYFEMPPLDCAPPPDVDIDTLLLVAIDEWDGQAGTYAVGPDGPAQAAMGLSPPDEPAIGSITLDVSEPYHPILLELDFEQAGVSYQGALELAQCSYVSPMPCDAETSG